MSSTCSVEGDLDDATFMSFAFSLWAIAREVKRRWPTEAEAVRARKAIVALAWLIYPH